MHKKTRGKCRMYDMEHADTNNEGYNIDSIIWIL